MDTRANTIPKGCVLLTGNFGALGALSDGMLNLIYLDRLFNTVDLNVLPRSLRAESQ